MSPTFVFSNLPAHVREKILVVQQQRFPGISLVFATNEEEVERYFLRQEPYCNRNHPAPHVVVMFVTESDELIQSRSFWQQIPDRKPPVLLMWDRKPADACLKSAELPIAGILDLEQQRDLDVLSEELLDFWGTIVKLPLV